MRVHRWPWQGLIVVMLLLMGASAASAFQVKCIWCDHSGGIGGIEVKVYRNETIQVAHGYTGIGGVYNFTLPTAPIEGEFLEFKIKKGTDLTEVCCQVYYDEGSPLLMYTEPCLGLEGELLCDDGISTVDGVLVLEYELQEVE